MRGLLLTVELPEVWTGRKKLVCGAEACVLRRELPTYPDAQHRLRLSHASWSKSKVIKDHVPCYTISRARDHADYKQKDDAGDLPAELQGSRSV